MELDTAAVLERVKRYKLLGGLQLLEASTTLAPRCETGRDFAAELLARGWVTPYQAEALPFRTQLVGLGPYRLLARLGSGGVSHVYKATDTRSNWLVALKVLHEDAQTNPETLARFEREIKVAAGLDHPNIVKFVDADIASGKLAYLAMEFVPGIDLNQVLIARERVEVPAACDYIAQAAEGLQHAHEGGLIHRDIKPANLLVSIPGWTTAPTAENAASTAAGKVVKLLDLGLARTQQVAGHTSNSVTGQGSLLGTPDYMAPEQGRNPKGVDIRADIYSLGCTLYHLLTGTVPFSGGNVMQKLFRHVSEPVVRPDRLNPAVPTALGDLVVWMMAKDLRARPAQPLLVAERLMAFAG